MASNAELAILIGAKDEASKVLGEVNKSVGGMEKKFQEVGKTLQRTGAIMSAAVSGPLLLLGKSAIDAASSTEESLNKVRVVFGQGSKAIEAFALTASTNLGLSRQGALEAAGTFGNLFVAMGITGTEAAGMSTRMLTLAADLASFNNMDPTEVLEKLRSGLVGQTEPLRTVGVNLNQARIEAEALAIGLVKPVANQAQITKAHLAVADSVRDIAVATRQYGKDSFEAQKARNALELAEQGLAKAIEGSVGDLTAAQKAQAAYSIILKDTATAQGDFKNTSDGLANSQRIAKAAFEDVQAQLGAELLPVMLEVVKVVKDALTAFKGIDPEMRRTIVIVAAVVFAIGPLLGVLGTIITLAPMVAGAFMLMLGPIGLVVAAVGVLAFAWSRNMFQIQDKAQELTDWMRSWSAKEWPQIGSDIVSGLWNGIRNNWHLILNPLGSLAAGLMTVVKEALGIHSASVEFGGIGEDIVGGLSKGIRDGHDRITNDAARMAAAAIAGSKNTLTAGLPELLASAHALGATIPIGMAQGVEDNKPIFAMVARNALQELGFELRAMAEATAAAVASAASEAHRRTLEFAGQARIIDPEGLGTSVTANPLTDPVAWRAQMLRIGFNPDLPLAGRPGQFARFDPVGGIKAETVQFGAGPIIRLPGFQQGGIVPGSGPRLVVAHGGEEIRRPDQRGGLTINFYGDLYGLLDFEQQIKRIVRDNFPAAVTS